MWITRLCEAFIRHFPPPSQLLSSWNTARACTPTRAQATRLPNHIFLASPNISERDIVVIGLSCDEPEDHSPPEQGVKHHHEHHHDTRDHPYREEDVVPRGIPEPLECPIDQLICEYAEPGDLDLWMRARTSPSSTSTTRRAKGILR
jgi:hypothetical protein